VRFGAGVWLCAHLAVVALTPVSLLASAPQAADAVICTCTHTGHAECPMHHPKPRDKGKHSCECRSATDPDAASIVTLLGPIAVLADAPASLAPPPITRLPNYPITRFQDSVTAPDGPPPRA